MKKTKIFALLLALVMVFSLAACGEKGGDDKDPVKDPTADLEEYDTGAGLKVKMEKGMKKETLETVTAFYYGDNSMMTALREDFSYAVEAAGVDTSKLSIEEYNDMMLEAYKEIDEFKKDSNGNYYATYVKEVSGQNFYYFCTIRKGSDCFWIVNFACQESEKDAYQPQFELWSNTIEVA